MELVGTVTSAEIQLLLVGVLFRAVFPDSDIAIKFSCGSNKCSYLVRFGLAPYLKELLLKCVKESGYIVAMFDESWNTVTKRKQLDVHVRSWIDGQVTTRYLTSQFMGHATADNVVDHFRTGLEGLRLKQILQISMDGPNVNWKFLEKFQGELKREFDIMLLNVGSCGLHVVHGAFKDGLKASGWEVDRFMGSAY